MPPGRRLAAQFAVTCLVSWLQEQTRQLQAQIDELRKQAES